jgi:hypothetical protein
MSLVNGFARIRHCNGGPTSRRKRRRGAAQTDEGQCELIHQPSCPQSSDAVRRRVRSDHSAVRDCDCHNLVGNLGDTYQPQPELCWSARLVSFRSLVLRHSRTLDLCNSSYSRVGESPRQQVRYARKAPPSEGLMRTWHLEAVSFWPSTGYFPVRIAGWLLLECYLRGRCCRLPGGCNSSRRSCGERDWSDSMRLSRAVPGPVDPSPTEWGLECGGA